MSTLNVRIEENDIKGSNTDSGYFLDEIAKSLGRWDSLEVDEENLDYVHENTRYVVENFDFEAAYIEWLNNEGKVGMLNIKDRKEFEAQDLMLGAWLALERPDTFEAMLDRFKESETDLAQDHDITKSKLSEEVEQAEDDARESLYKQWLYGDRDDEGLLEAFSKRLTESRGNVEYSEKERSLTISVSREDAAEYLEEYNGENDYDYYMSLTDEALAEDYKTEVCNWVERNAYSNVQQEKRENEKRNAEYKRVREYQAEMKAKTEAARVEKLKSMRKEG